ncbi:hypothetical protein Phum_PHUM301420 [Pediculus humanus corporis]|uniref:Uncharacterized protein n=1 Tax=Pediculus humanus subsp. corporis TaxID=121224 RepID=E0VM62_PEDHC|nr:uncharacterized protein Phum_PHUM301420 [Pediculus humanus corporis]EEB14468.1 hypothetical protein Phum_PHUM301420 [Pediculus humanus corporis]
MFIPDTLRSCMVEPDVSTYLQTPSSGQGCEKMIEREKKGNDAVVYIGERW